MKITRLLGIALIGLIVAIGASSCCSLQRYLTLHAIGLDSGVHNMSVQVRVTLILRNISVSSSSEWKIASDQMCTQSTGQIRPDAGDYEQTWEMGGTQQHIWFWWDTLNGEVDATLLVNDIVVFEGRCTHFGTDKIQMIKTCSYPRVYRTFGTGPYLRDPLDRIETDIIFATSDLPPRFGTFLLKAGTEH